MFDYGGRFKTMLKSFANTNRTLRHIKPTNCSVSTMTVCGKVDTPVDINAVMALDAEDYGLTVPESPTKRSKTPKTFFNQLTIKSGTTSVKIFSNGAVHVTGVKSLVHFADVIDRVCMALGTVMDRQPGLESASISMINAIFCVACKLPLRTLRDAFEKAGHVASYDPDAYPGINAKINKITVMIFTTGNVIISGAKSPEHVSDVYDAVCIVIDSLGPAAARVRAATSTGNLDMYTIVNGYSSRIANLCIDGTNEF